MRMRERRAAAGGESERAARITGLQPLKRNQVGLLLLVIS
jgi:hypothetical protein